jgi:serine/threonine-protein kinase RsbW
VPLRNDMLNGHQSDATNLVEIRVRADLKQLYALRSLAAALALHADFDLDDIADLKLAVDEMCSALVAIARPGELLACQFDMTPNSVGVLASVGCDRDQPIRQDTFGWRVLTTLTDHTTTWTTPGHLSPYTAYVWIGKTRHEYDGQGVAM